MVNNPKFNIRVYGLLIANNNVLVSDEFLWGKSVTKFPGGGLEWGEGVLDCLKREFMEELGLKIHHEKLFYVTDFFQESFLNKEHQIISIYYTVACSNPELIEVSTKPHNHAKLEQGRQVFKWINLQALDSNDFYFPIDKIVVEMAQKLH